MADSLIAVDLQASGDLVADCVIKNEMLHVCSDAWRVYDISHVLRGSGYPKMYKTSYVFRRVKVTPNVLDIFCVQEGQGTPKMYDIFYVFRRVRVTPKCMRYLMCSGGLG